MLCLVIALMCFAPAASAAVDYPQGVTREQSKQAMVKLDVVLLVLLNQSGKTMWQDYVMPLVCNDGTLNSLVKGLYTELSSNAETFSTIGIKFAPNDVASVFGAYPDVQQRLLAATDWNSVNLDGAKWGVSEKEGFTTAMVTALSPFNELLYTILCGGSYSLNPLIGITGALGYENAVLSVYSNLGIEECTAPETFYANAATDRNSMIRSIVSDVLAFLEKCSNAPMTKLSTLLPQIAAYIQSGGLDSAISTLVEPIKIKVLGITTPFKVGSMIESIGESEGGMSLDFSLGDMLTVEGFQTAPFDLDTLASCGNDITGQFVAETGDSFIYLLKWIIDTLKLNSASLPNMIGQLMPQTNSVDLGAVFTNLFAKSTDEIAKSLIEFLTASSGKTNPYVWSFASQQTSQVSYTANLGKDKFQRVLDGIDPLLSEFVKEGGEYKNVREALQVQIYSNKVVTELMLTVYRLMEDVKLKEILELTGLKVTPYSLSECLTEDEFYGSSRVLSSYGSFTAIPDNEVFTWGFADGNRSGFINAVCAIFRPLDKLLRMALTGDKITVLGAVNIYGSDGYNTAVIPILEALGCTYDKIPSYDEYVQKTKDGDMMLPIVTAIDSLIVRIMDAPVKTLTEILPNLMYFLNGGGIKICVENLLYPVTELLNEFGAASLVDLSQLTNIDVKALISSLIKELNLGISLPELDTEQFASMGTLMTVQTHRTQGGAPMTVSYVQADQTAVLVTFLRYLVEVLKAPGNESLMTSFMSSDTEGGNAMFATYSQGIGDEMAKMNTDETIEWLYKLFFRERAVDVQLQEKEYMPTIIYNEKFHRGLSSKTVSLIILLLMILVMVAVINRERLMPFVLKLKANFSHLKEKQSRRSQ